MSVIILVIFVLACLSIDYYLKKRRKRVIEKSPILHNKTFQLRQNRVLVPQGIYFAKSHAWAYLIETGLVRVGLDDFLKHIIGRVTRISASGNNASIIQNEALLNLEQDEKKLTIAAPISGRVKRINPEILNNPQNALGLPYKDRWIYELEPANWEEETKNLHLGRTASKWIEKEFIRLKEFFAYLMSGDGSSSAYATILQDGGEIAEKVLEYSGQETWQKFQVEFLDQQS
ncbi:MAG: hypothetical protein ABIA75_07730 [Candidatus Neomarinimicrobiota bacterium]